MRTEIWCSVGLACPVLALALCFIDAKNKEHHQSEKTVGQARSAVEGWWWLAVAHFSSSIMG